MLSYQVTGGASIIWFWALSEGASASSPSREGSERQKSHIWSIGMDINMSIHVSTLPNTWTSIYIYIYMYNIYIDTYIHTYKYIYIHTLSRIDEYVPTKFLRRSCNLLQAHSLHARPPTSDNTPLEFAREAIPSMMCQELAMPTITLLTELQKKKTTHCSRQSRLPSHPKQKKWRIWIRRPAGVLCGCSCDTSCDNFSFTYI